MRKSLFTMVGLALVLAGTNLWAQSSGSITGQVTDTSGAAVPGASVTVTNEATQAKRVVGTDSAGIYDVPSLIPGIYTVAIEAKGFRIAERKGLELQVQQAMRLDFQLQVGEVTQAVEVQGGAVQLNTQNATVGSVIENQRIVDLPLNGRDFLQLTALDANVSFGVGNENGSGASRLGGQRITEMISVAGGRTEYNYYSLDGVSDTDVSFNTYTFLPSIDALQEFKIQTGVFPAEFGRGTAEINVTTKPGTNDLHGALFEFVRNSSTDAQSYCFNPIASTGKCLPGNILHQNQFGGTVGGSVYIPHLFDGRNKLFFMFNYEGLRRSQAVNESAEVLTPEERNGDFTGDIPGSTTPFPTLYDPNTRVLNSAGTSVVSAQTFASECGGANVIPNGTNCGGIPSRFDATDVKLAAYDPLPNASGANNYLAGIPNTQTNNQYTVRMDYNQNVNTTWFGRVSWDTEVGTLINGAIKEANDRISAAPFQFELSNVHTFSPTLVNDFRFGYNRLISDVYNYNAVTGQNVVGQLGGIPGVATPYPAIYGVPSTNVTNLTGWGDDSGIPFLTGDNTWQFADTVAKVHGKHSLRFGADVRRDDFDSAGNSFIRGAFSWNGQYTNNPSLAPSCATNTTYCEGGRPEADFLLGDINLFDAALALAQTELRNTSQAYFVDDTWHVTKKLTINAGLRYEYIAPYTEKHDNVANILWPAPNESASTGFLGSSGPTQLNQPVFVRPGKGDFYANTPAIFQFGGGILTARTNDAPGMCGASLYCTWKSNFAPRLGIAYSPTPNWVIRVGGGSSIPRISMTSSSTPDATWPPAARTRPMRCLPTSARKTPWELAVLRSVFSSPSCLRRQRHEDHLCRAVPSRCSAAGYAHAVRYSGLPGQHGATAIKG